MGEQFPCFNVILTEFNIGKKIVFKDVNILII